MIWLPAAETVGEVTEGRIKELLMPDAASPRSLTTGVSASTDDI